MSLILPTTPLATAAELAALAQKVATNASAIAAAVTSIQNLAAQLGLDEAQIAKLVAAATPPPIVIPPIIVPPYDPQVFWRATMESGSLVEWAVPNNNTGAALSSAVQAAAEGIPARTPWVLKQQVSANGAATRMGATSIVAQVKSGTPWWVTWWDFYPTPIRFGAADMFAFFQIAGLDANLNYNPVWGFFLNGVDGTPLITWSPNNMAPAEGPHAGETGRRTYTTTTPVPIGKWTKFELYIDASQNFAGALQLYMDRALIFEQSAIRTRYPGTGDSGVAGYMYLEHLAYGSPGVHYLDDVSYSLGRMPA